MFLSHHLAQAHRRGRREGKSAGRPRSRPAWLRTSATGHKGTAHRDLQTGWGWGLPTYHLGIQYDTIPSKHGGFSTQCLCDDWFKDKNEQKPWFLRSPNQIFCSSLMEVDARNHNSSRNRNVYYDKNTEYSTRGIKDKQPVVPQTSFEPLKITISHPSIQLGWEML